MAGRDTRVAPRVLRPIHRSLRVVPFGGVDISRRKPFLIIGVASRRRPRARYLAGPASPAKRGGKILLRDAGADAGAAERTAAIRAERPLRPAHPQKETGTSAASTLGLRNTSRFSAVWQRRSRILEPLAEMRRAIGKCGQSPRPHLTSPYTLCGERCGEGPE
jgi:hypothetical protein